ncbi:hypothetical protein JOC36_000224 [Weissella uvarum]|uniref:hypothetical protein n=1 Tax=Weissella uvarum TaxID=1479233 RepID=UPI00195F428F|nr:hypothetical protein [Weissella uvarum]MBM7616691.1 hypothetical protein [Weissella uvarum]MCM0594854.1 hypothetical protein [Weissella uvarum]
MTKAYIEVEDTYGIIRTANELLSAIYFAEADPDLSVATSANVTDALSQFELQAVDLSQSLGGTLMSSDALSEENDVKLSEHNSEQPFSEMVTNIVYALEQEVSKDELNKVVIRSLQRQLDDALEIYQGMYLISDDDADTIQIVKDISHTLYRALDDYDALGYVPNEDGTSHKQTLGELAELLSNQLWQLNNM